MNTRASFARLALAAILSLSLLPALAGEGHDHGEAPSAVAGPAAPRFAASSDSFELVGVLNGTTLNLFLDKTDTNEPVKSATLELELGGVKLAAQAKGEGEFEAKLQARPAAGTLPVTATVVSGGESDLLAGELDIHEEAHAESAAVAGNWRTWVVWGGGALVVVLVLVGVARTRKGRQGSQA